jgi:CubicO group peptidase (beta-lactamase class C family)
VLKVIVTALTLTHGDGLPSKAPDAVGMSASRLESIDRVVQRGITAGGYPGAAVVVGRKGAAVWQKGFGKLSWSASDSPVEAETTIYDVASLSKVVGTTTAVMVLYDENKIDLDAPVLRYLPAFSGGLKDKVTVRDLLTHRSGLPAGRDLWRKARSPQEARDMVLASALVYRPNEGYIYSDLGADILGMIVEEVSGERLDQSLSRRVFSPLGMNHTFYRPADSLRYRIAPTEVSPPRGYPIRGEVHDENAYALGGIAGHAGLFSTAADLSVFAQMMLNKGSYDGVRIISDSTVDLFTRRTAGHRALGWDTAEGDYGSGKYLTERSYGHTGFTGTSIWIDAAVLAVVDGPNPVLAMPASFRADDQAGWTKPKPVRCTKATKGRTARSKRARVSCSSARTVKAKKPAKSRSSKSVKAKSSKSASAKKKATTKKSTASKSKTSRTAKSG